MDENAHEAKPDLLCCRGHKLSLVISLLKPYQICPRLCRPPSTPLPSTAAAACVALPHCPPVALHLTGKLPCFLFYLDRISKVGDKQPFSLQGHKRWFLGASAPSCPLVSHLTGPVSTRVHPADSFSAEPSVIVTGMPLQPSKFYAMPLYMTYPVLVVSSI